MRVEYQKEVEINMDEKTRELIILEELEPKRNGANIWYKVKSKEATQIMKILGIHKIENKIKC